jgi:hypothetical protein
MKRKMLERQLSHLEEQVRALPDNGALELIRFTTKKESLRMLELFSKLKNIKQPLWEKYAPEETKELIELFVTSRKRRDEQAGGE